MSSSRCGSAPCCTSQATRAPGSGLERAEHLSEIKIPQLFLQGSRDEFAQLDLLQATVDGLGVLATLKLLDSADHAFHVPAKTGRKDPEVLGEALDAARDWMLSVKR